MKPLILLLITLNFAKANPSQIHLNCKTEADLTGVSFEFDLKIKPSHLAGWELDTNNSSFFVKNANSGQVQMMSEGAATLHLHSVTVNSESGEIKMTGRQSNLVELTEKTNTLHTNLKSGEFAFIKTLNFKGQSSSISTVMQGECRSF